MKITTYKTITLTPKDTPQSLLKKIEEKGMYISSYAKDIATKIPERTKKETFDIGMTTIAELGFTVYPTTTELFAKIKELGYDLCPPETGLYLRLNNYDQEVGWYYIAMEPIADSDGYPSVFFVERDGDGERWLRTDWTNPGFQWPLGRRIVFRLRKTLELSTSEPQSSVLSPLDTLTLESAIQKVKAAGYVVFNPL